MTATAKETRDYERAYREAKRLLLPGSFTYPSQRGVIKGDTDAWRLARAQWLYDHVSRRLGEAELKDINALRRARDFDKPGQYPPLDLKRRKAVAAAGPV